MYAEHLSLLALYVCVCDVRYGGRRLEEKKSKLMQNQLRPCENIIMFDQQFRERISQSAEFKQM